MGTRKKKMRLTQKMLEKIFLLNGCTPDGDTASGPGEGEDTAEPEEDSADLPDEGLDLPGDTVFEEGHKVGGEEKTINEKADLDNLEKYYMDAKNAKYKGDVFTNHQLPDNFKGKILMAKEGWLVEEKNGIKPDFALVYVSEDKNIVDVIWYKYETVDGVKVAKATNPSPGFKAFSKYEYNEGEDYYEFYRRENGVKTFYRIRFKATKLDNESYEMHLIGLKGGEGEDSLEFDPTTKSKLTDVSNVFSLPVGRGGYR